MIRLRKNQKAQAVMSEYAVVIAMMLAVIVAMTVYFKRAVQARVYDARSYMIEEVRERTAGEYDGPLYREYEPYYIHSNANVYRRVEEKSELIPGDSSGIFKKFYNERVETKTDGKTLPPRDFDATTPAPQ